MHHSACFLNWGNEDRTQVLFFFCMQYKHFQLQQFFEAGFCYVVQTDVGFTILLQASMCFSCGYLSLHPVHVHLSLHPVHIHLLMYLKTYM